MEPMELNPELELTDEARNAVRDALDDVAPPPEAPPGPFECPECEREFETQRGLSKHFTEVHEGGTGRHSRGPEPEKEKARPKAKPGPKPAGRKKSNSVQMAMFLGYRLAGAAFATWGPPPDNVRQTVGGSMVMTAGPAAAGMDRVAKRTPIYPILEAVCSATGLVDDLMPLGIPLFLGMYGYAPQAARQRMRPLASQALTMMFASLFGVEMPVEAEVQEVTAGIQPTPEGMQQLSEALLGALEMGDVGTAAPAAA